MLSKLLKKIANGSYLLYVGYSIKIPLFHYLLYLQDYFLLETFLNFVRIIKHKKQPIVLSFGKD